MIEPEVIQSRGQRPRHASTGWLSAYQAFLLSRHEPMTLKLAPLALLGYLPINILDEFIPVIGWLDDIPYALLVGIVIFNTARRVRKYR